MDEDRSEAYFEGQEASRQGCKDSECPYPNGTDEAMDWQDGLASQKIKTKPMKTRMAIFLRLLVVRGFNPAILWCYGWKRERSMSHGILFEAWVDPFDGMRYSIEIAIARCESRIELR